ncbi:cobalamin biosynthesis protein CobD [Shewanella livingstonensis]|uniref:Cobalamin biosynthesis protein CobD n=2 Tax=Shewanella livingstonensis TaxID=150120 RepID=A0A3G8LZX0_9GAMM|nr:cobalamin biosynthesis protein CobD [Shewanella livingstonensis]
MFWQVCAALVIALTLDKLLGEPKRFHPLIGLGNVISFIEKKYYAKRRINGVVAVVLLSLPVTLLYWVNIPWWLQAVVLYFVIGGRSLGEHGRAVADALRQNDLSLARERVGYIVSRRTENLDESQVINATIESMLENGNDAVFGALFWFIVGGAPAAIIYRIANTLDARWGYKNDKYFLFGWFAANWDDWLNYIPARLCVLTYAIQGNVADALTCARVQGAQCASPNGGPVMASGAGSLGITIGGAAEYDGYKCDKPLLGKGPKPDWNSINNAIQLVDRGAILWAVCLGIVYFSLLLSQGISL